MTKLLKNVILEPNKAIEIDTNVVFLTKLALKQ